MTNHTVGILIIGSLMWDARDHRISWRRNRLKAGPAIPVRAPIRYGRISRWRKNTYTMVFSNELSAERMGWALAVPCRCVVHNADQLIQEAQALWAAEQPKPSMPGPLSGDWGAVGLLCNPMCTTLETIRNDWTERVGEEHNNYATFEHVDRELPAVGADGALTISWPTTESGDALAMDLLLATATQPNLDDARAYATPGTIANAWKLQPKQQRYFDENRRAGITTADDYSIIRHLCEAGQQER